MSCMFQLSRICILYLLRQLVLSVSFPIGRLKLKIQFNFINSYVFLLKLQFLFLGYVAHRETGIEIIKSDHARDTVSRTANKGENITQRTTTKNKGTYMYIKFVTDFSNFTNKHASGRPTRN